MSSSDPSKSVRVVIVEDDAATRKMLVSILETTPGYSVVAEFGEGKIAIRSLAATIPDLMLVDLGLPDIPGIQVIRETAAVCPECDLLVVTTFGDEQSVYLALKAGADGYLLKGATTEELRRDIQALRLGGSPLSPAVARKVLQEFAKKKDTTDNKEGEVATHSLTAREVKILEMIGRGFSYDETAKHFKIARDTVHAHLKNIYRKLAVHSKMEAVYEARRKKIIR